jgi:AcrR family transcriptional regulator
MKEKILGRPRNFNEEDALKKALQVFWKKGFEGASLTDLITEMGINKPSLYAAFGDKETLFVRATEYYGMFYQENALKHLALPKYKDAMTAFFNYGIEFMAGGKNPLGCMAVHGTITSNKKPTVHEQAILHLREGFEKMLLKRTLQAVKEKDFPKNLDPHDFAKYLTSVYQGMTIQAMSSSKPDELRKIPEIALSLLV